MPLPKLFLTNEVAATFARILGHPVPVEAVPATPGAAFSSRNEGSDTPNSNARWL